MINKSILKKVYKPRKKTSHKYDYGLLLVIGGSHLYHGSPLFNSLAAYRSGVDLVLTVCPERAANLVASHGPDLITYSLKGIYITTKHTKTLVKLSKKADAVIIGGGMGGPNGLTLESWKAIQNFLEKIEKPCVIDADALKSINNIKQNFLLTPHSKEFEELTNTKANKTNLKKFAKQNNCTILLKGNKDVVADKNNIKENKTGSPFLTVGGTGDILAGVCGSLLAQGNNIFDSACAAAYITGKAGEKASKKYKQGLMASDLLDEIPEVIK